MVIDSSAIIAILTNEPDADLFASAIEGDTTRLMSAATLLEISIVIEARYGLEGGLKLDEFLEVAQIETRSVTPQDAELARSAYRAFGKGRHPASLNFGDCFSYALAKATNEPLLFKGDDFTKTDIKSAVDME